MAALFVSRQEANGKSDEEMPSCGMVTINILGVPLRRRIRSDFARDDRLRAGFNSLVKFTLSEIRAAEGGCVP